MLPHPDQSDAQFDAMIAKARAMRRRRGITAVLLLLCCATGALIWAVAPGLLHQIRARQMQQAHDERIAAMTGFERVHAELLPNWAIAQANRRPDAPNEYATLKASLGQSPKLEALLDELWEITKDDESLGARAREIPQLVQSWNIAMDQAGKPWWMEANVIATATTMLFYIKTYKVLADFKVPVGTHHHRVRIVGRADRTNVVESLLGHTSPHQEGAIILADRIMEFTHHSIWPALADAHSSDGLISQLQHEVQAALPPPLYAPLKQAAPARARMQQVVQSVEARQACGSRFHLRSPGYKGFSPETMDRLAAYAKRDAHSSCPSLTREEFATLDAAQQELGAIKGLRAGVEALGALIARAIVAHEMMHAHDDKTSDIFNKNLPCIPCDERGLGRSTRAELSAYLGSLIAPGSNHLALYQMCGIQQQPGPHGQATRLILGQLHYTCGQAAPIKELSARAKAMQTSWFGPLPEVDLSSCEVPNVLEVYDDP